MLSRRFLTLSLHMKLGVSSSATRKVDENLELLVQQYVDNAR